MQDENVRLVGRVPVVPRSDPGGVFCSCEGSPFVDKEVDERANSYVGGSIMKNPLLALLSAGCQMLLFLKLQRLLPR